ncbi:volume-regulated anion channel subunit LRRC8D-like [Protopterus annectens]|uniref:volume-regulated anion channel subunit LRRC8D-like n=1 Tax=Protopterus annectens TaxID=7888 RepID=UPI001CF9F9D9|nr:volume-regulated anion channel subunit LRRC8D-like [Protopterus annectens]
MFTSSEVALLNETGAHYKILKPWWDVIMEHLVMVMLMSSVFMGALMMLKDKVVCLPMDYGNITSGSSKSESVPVQNPTFSSGSATQTALQAMPIESTKATTVPPPSQLGRQTKLDLQQYIYISHVCYQKAFPWYCKYFPYLALMQSVILMLSNNFWFKYPKTSSKIEHLITILGKCFESPWTTNALAVRAWQDPKINKSKIKLSTEEKPESKVKHDSSTASNCDMQFDSSTSKMTSATILDKKDWEQAKTLFERVRIFRAHTEDGNVIYTCYVGQTVFKVLKFFIIIGYTSTIVGAITFEHICMPSIQTLTGWSTFFCIHNMAFMAKIFVLIYITLVSMYGMIGIYALFWSFTQPLKDYSFEKVREETKFTDIPDVKNDFAFLLHMVDQYDPLFSKRFAIFMSEDSEIRLWKVNLDHEWTYEKLKQYVSRNTSGQLELQLFMLPGLPKAVFDMSDLEVLSLEFMPDVKFPDMVSQMVSMKELHLLYSPAKVDQNALSLFKKQLLVLHVKFTKVREIPLWIYTLKTLRELHLSGSLNSENKMIPLESFKELRNLKILVIKSNIFKIPSSINDVALQLTKMIIENDGTKLVFTNSLKNMVNLSELQLENCKLEQIPKVIFSMTSLQKLDLKSNAIWSVKDISNFIYLKRLTCLRLWHNNIPSVPNTISNIKILEQLFLSNNKLTDLPSGIFMLKKLIILDVSNNLIKILPEEIGQLEALQNLTISDNILAALPVQLFNCVRLKSLNLSNNNLIVLPAEVGWLTQLMHLDLKGNCLDSLPWQIACCSLLKKSGFIVEDYLYETLPSEVQKQFSDTSFVTTIRNAITESK